MGIRSKGASPGVSRRYLARGLGVRGLILELFERAFKDLSGTDTLGRSRSDRQVRAARRTAVVWLIDRETEPLWEAVCPLPVPTVLRDKGWPEAARATLPDMSDRERQAVLQALRVLEGTEELAGSVG